LSFLEYLGVLLYSRISLNGELSSGSVKNSILLRWACGTRVLTGPYALRNIAIR